MNFLRFARDYFAMATDIISRFLPKYADKMTTGARPDLPDDASEGMYDYLDHLIDATRLANGAYDDIETADMVSVLRHRAKLYDQFGTTALHPRNQTQEDDIPVLEGMVVQADDGTIESTDRRWYNVDIGFKTGLMHGADLSDDEMATVLQHLAEFLETNGRLAVGSREPHSEK